MKMTQIEVVPLAFDSLGTRSMATFIATNELKIIIDPAVSLAPIRYGLPPHELELNRMDEHWKAIMQYANEADIVIITHYHYDHHNPSHPEIYKDKIVFLKDPKNNINLSQRGRAKYFLEVIEGYPKEIHVSDGMEYKYGSTKIKFSKAVFHGTSSRLGYVTEALIEDSDEKFLFTSDVEGPAISEQMDFIIRADPDIIFCDGPMTYMLGYRYSQTDLNNSISNLIKIIQETRVSQLVLDHHLTRDIGWRQKLLPVFEAGETRGCKVLSAANFMGLNDDMLEAMRKELYRR
ncbi:MAG: hypothetical protein QMD71_07830 [bacterium]|nr:hypothetical protein [bacterium]